MEQVAYDGDAMAQYNMGWITARGLLSEDGLMQDRDVAKAAGDKILEIYNKESFNNQLKIDNSPLTEADTAAHNLIQQRLEMITPTIPILSEESSAIPWDKRKKWECYWLVDPLDGTKEFIKKNGEFSVNIALGSR